MTLDQIAEQVGKNLKYFTTAGGWLTNRDVTEDDIKAQANYLYRDDIFPMIVTQWPWYGRQVAHTNSWIATGIADVSSTGTTLVATTSIFTNSMVTTPEYLTVYNSTDDSTAKITGYTSGTTVTLDTTIGNTWDGDTIYVLGKTFELGGGAADSYTVEEVGVKYLSSDTSYRRARPRDRFDFMQRGSERGSEADPEYFLTTITNASSVLKTAIEFARPFTSKITDAIEVYYTVKPAELTDSDSPRMPADLCLVYGTTEWAFRQRSEHDKADIWAIKYMAECKKLMSRFRPNSTDEAVRMRPPRRFSAIMNSNI